MVRNGIRTMSFHTFLQYSTFWPIKKIPTTFQFMYLLGLASCDIWLFLNLKLGLKGESFELIEDIKIST